MAKYTTSVSTGWTPSEAFSYMADFRNLANWDPGVKRVSVSGGQDQHAVYDVELKAGVRPLVLRYEVTEWDPPNRVVLMARSKSLVSTDQITVVAAEGTGSVVTYDADLRLAGIARLADPVLPLVLRRVGDRAAKGLRRVLEGDRTVTS